VLDKSPLESVKLRVKMVGAATAATTGEAETGGESRLDLPPASLALIVTELSRIKSVIGIRYPEMEFFWRSAPGKYSAPSLA
jgi:hypothetical protein